MPEMPRESARERIRRTRSTGFPPRSVVWIVALGSLAIAALASGLGFWWRILLAVEGLYFTGLLLLARRGKLQDELPYDSAPMERRRARPEAWRRVADRAGLRLKEGEPLEMSGHWRFVPVAVVYTRKGGGFTTVTARPPRIALVSLRITPAGDDGSGDEDMAFAYRVRCSPRKNASRLLGDDARDLLLGLADVEVEFRWRTLHLKTRGFEGDPERLCRLLDLAVEISHGAQAVSARSSDEEE